MTIDDIEAIERYENGYALTQSQIDALKCSSAVKKYIAHCIKSNRAAHSLPSDSPAWEYRNGYWWNRDGSVCRVDDPT